MYQCTEINVEINKPSAYSFYSTSTHMHMTTEKHLIYTTQKEVNDAFLKSRQGFFFQCFMAPSCPQQSRLYAQRKVKKMTHFLCHSIIHKGKCRQHHIIISRVTDLIYLHFLPHSEEHSQGALQYKSQCGQRTLGREDVQ